MKLQCDKTADRASLSADPIRNGGSKRAGDPDPAHKRYPHVGIAALLAFAVLTASAFPATAASRRHYRILSNVRCDAKASGMVGAVEVDVASQGEPQRVTTLVDAAIYREQKRLHAAHCKAKEILRRMRRLPPSGRIGLSRRIVWTHQGKALLPDLDHARRTGQRFGGGTLHFAYSGWSATDQQKLSTFVNRAYPVMVAVYGQPAFSNRVTIQQDAGLDVIDGGVYDATANEIRIPPILNPGTDSFNLVHLILHAFHDDLMFSYDAWEEGFARAAALIVQTRVDPTFSPGDPNAPGGSDPFYVLSLYDFLNQPPLGNAMFFPPSADIGGLGGTLATWRIGMAESAWIKVAAENVNFFRDFNNAYYAAYKTDLNGNTPALKQLALPIVPNVEGQPFTDWYRKQCVLDTSIAVGSKLFIFQTPLDHAATLILCYYSTSSSGDETPMGGTAELIYSNYLQHDFYVEEGNLVDIPASGEDAGLGFIGPQFFNIGDASRVTIDVTLGGLAARIYYPYRVSGVGDFNPLFGICLGSETGTLALSGAFTGMAQVNHGVFAFPALPQLNAPARLTMNYTAQDTGQNVILQKNLAWDYYAPIFVSPFQVVTLTHTYPKGTTGYQMLALPGRPLVSDEATIFGVSPNRFLMARWRPEIPGENKYELYPNITTPLGPGIGAWVKLENDARVSVQAETIPHGADFQLHLSSGFNQIGAPTDATFNLSDLSVQIPGSAPVDFGSAQAAGLISSGVFLYSQTDGYRLVTSLSGWNGYWLRVINPTGLYLVFPASAGASVPVATRTSASMVTRPLSRGTSILPGPIGLDQRQMRRDNWCIRMSAVASFAKDLDNYLGVTPGATDGLDNAKDIVQPPEFGGYVSLYFPVMSAQGEQRLAADLRAPFATRKDWHFVVTTNLGDTNITLTWDDLSRLRARQRNLRITLTDLDANTTRDMRTTTTYSFQSGYIAMRRFRVAVDATPPPRVKFSNIEWTRGPNGCILSFSASEPVRAAAEIFSPKGRRVRILIAKPLPDFRRYVLKWDLKDETGRVVPSGFYIVRFRAMDEAHRTYRRVKLFRIGP